MSANINRIDIEEFLYREAALLDAWKLEEWLALFTEDAHYFVPTVGTAAEVQPDNTLFYIADDRLRLKERVIRLQKKGAHVEWPRSRTRHLVSNVLIDSRDGEDMVVSAGFSIYRFKNGNSDNYVGSYRYRLCIESDAIRIREKRCMLDMDALRPHGRVSIIL